MGATATISSNTHARRICSARRGQDDDKHLGQKESEAFRLVDLEEKIDGTNIGIHFTSGGRMVLQCCGHKITEGMHPQYDLFK